MTVKDEYFDWMCEQVNAKDYNKLLSLLNDEVFYYTLPLDDNRLLDGIELRYAFGDECGVPKTVIDEVFYNDKCSVLEMILGLAMRIENTIMSDWDFGDRTQIWFWMMIKSLGLYEMTDSEFDVRYCMDVVDTFLKREYDPDGSGGLFHLPNINEDMRKIDIWFQMCMYFDNLL